MLMYHLQSFELEINDIDNVPHSWAEKSIELLGGNCKIVTFCKLSMEIWNSVLQVKAQWELKQLPPIQI
jgi:hypothetical protein